MHFIRKIALLGAFITIGPAYAMQEEHELPKTSIPNVPIPTITEQIKMYREAYAPYNHPGFNGNKTPIEGLIPLAKIAHSYTAKLLPSKDPRHQKLASFWEETQQSIKNHQLTIPYFKKMNLRLALLVSKERELSLLASRIALLQRLKTSPDWENLDSYEAVASQTEDLGPLKGQPYPLCFEAILYHESGIIKLTTFLDQFLNREMTLGLMAFPKPGKGAHGKAIDDPATLLFHDFTHWRDFVHDVGKKQKRICQYWPQIQAVARKIYEAKAPANPSTIAALFLLLHEYEPEAAVILDTESSLEQNGHDTPKISEHEILKRWVEESKSTINERDIMLSFIDYLFEAISREHSCLKDIQFTEFIIDKIQTENEYDIKFEMTKASDIFYVLGNGTARISLTPTENPYKAKAHASNVELARPETSTEEQEEVKLQREEAKKIVQGIINKVTFAPKYFYDSWYADLIWVLNYAYEEKKFSTADSPTDIKKGLTEFLDNFYESSLSVLK